MNGLKFYRIVDHEDRYRTVGSLETAIANHSAAKLGHGNTMDQKENKGRVAGGDGSVVLIELIFYVFARFSI